MMRKVLFIAALCLTALSVSVGAIPNTSTNITLVASDSKGCSKKASAKIDETVSSSNHSGLFAMGITSIRLTSESCENSDLVGNPHKGKGNGTATATVYGEFALKSDSNGTFSITPTIRKIPSTTPCQAGE